MPPSSIGNGTVKATVKVLVPAVPVMLIGPDPTIFILPAVGPTATESFPVSVTTGPPDELVPLKSICDTASP